MPHTRNRKAPKSHPQQPDTAPIHDESNLRVNSRSYMETIEKDKTELQLEKLVFGDDEGFKQGLKSFSKVENISHEHSSSNGQGSKEVDLAALNDADLFFVDSGPALRPHQDPVLVPTESSEADAWIDSEDDRLVVSLDSNPRLRKLRKYEGEDVINGKEYSRRLQQQFERLYPVPEWAIAKPASKSQRRSSHSSQSDDSADELSAQPLGKLLKDASLFNLAPASSRSGQQLRPEVVNISRLKDVTGAQSSAITSLSFNFHHSLLLSSGPLGSIFLHHISPSAPQPNPLITSLLIRNTPITTALFATSSSHSTTKIFFTGRRRFFHVWDLTSGVVEKVSRIYGQEDQRSMERFKLSPCGRWMGIVGSGKKGGGVVNVLDQRTCQWVAQVRVEGSGGVADYAWWSDGEGLTLVGKGGEVVEWSVAERRVLYRWVEEGSDTTVIVLGGTTASTLLGGDRWIVLGSSSGIVTVYDREVWAKTGSGPPARPVPFKSLKQLVTPTSILLISPSGEFLVMASRWKKDALRLVHLPSLTVYKNWPGPNTPLGRISAVAISPNSRMLAVANEQGKIRLWEIRG